MSDESVLLERKQILMLMDSIKFVQTASDSNFLGVELHPEDYKELNDLYELLNQGLKLVVIRSLDSD